MHDVQLSRPFPPILDLATRLIKEQAMGGVSLRQWREGYPQEQYAEGVELKSTDFVAWALTDAYRDDASYKPTVGFMDGSRARIFEQWLEGFRA